MRSLLLGILILIASSHAYGWGQTGHRVTGRVADQYLNKKAKKELDRILSGQSLAMASTWMDEIRSDSTYDYAIDWHWVTIQSGESYEQSKKNKNGDVIQTIERIITELKSKKLNSQQEAEAVKMLIHLIGDIHQPLHVGGGNDRGGNDVKIMWFRVDSNLHRVWDQDMIDDTRLSYTEFAESLEKPGDIKLKEWQKSSARDWANESISYRKQVYDYKNGKLSYEYSYHHLHIVRTRLLQAGIRIAAVLNEIYGA